VFRRVAAGALMTVVFVGGTAGTALAVESPSAASPAVAPSASPSASQSVVTTQTVVFSWPTASTASSTKSTAVRVIPADQGVVHRAGTATKIAAVWAVAATLAAAGVLAGSLLRR
jgi:predicted RecA/RadA family phage recombinase